MDEERLARLEDAIGQLVEVVQQVCDKMAAIDEEVDKLGANKIFDRLDGIEHEFGSMVGGLNDIIDGRKKREYSEQFRSAHPEFGRYEDIGKRFGLDVYGQAADTTYGAPDEEREGMIGSMLEELKGKFDDLIEALETHNAHEATEPAAEKMAEGEDTGKPAALSVEIATDGESDPETRKFADIAKLYRGRAVG